MTDKTRLAGKKVLLVDDEPDVLDALEELMPMCEIVKASNFKVAKNYLESRYFDITILDIMGVQGYELLDIATNRGVTAVMLTAHALSPGNIIRSFKQGAASYLPKAEMVNITSFLEDILAAEEHGKNPWTSWYGKMASFFEKKFGPQWQESDKDFWEKFPFY